MITGRSSIDIIAPKIVKVEIFQQTLHCSTGSLTLRMEKHVQAQEKYRIQAGICNCHVAKRDVVQ